MAVIQIDQEFKSKRKAAVAAGHKPFYLKDSDKKKMMLERKYEQLQKEGRLDKFLEKRRKKVASKQKRRLPRSRADLMGT